MSLLGHGAVAIWHDIAPEGRGDFYAWHGQEHMPERVGIPGFQRGRRYIAVDADLEFFNLYETASPAVLSGKDYLARLNAPTPWTQAAVRHFRNVARSLCRVTLSEGYAQGGLVATWRYDLSGAKPDTHEEMAKVLLRNIQTFESIAGTHLLMADAEASSTVNAEERARGQRNEVPGNIMLVEGWGDVSVFADTCRSITSPEALKAAGATGNIQLGIYQLQATVARLDIN
ncbi:MAG: hypothetical protein ACR2PG_16375 [Hyphomicrobiaceae bacterium]